MVEETRGSFDFSQGNTVVNWAISNGKTVRGSPIGKAALLLFDSAMR